MRDSGTLKGASAGSKHSAAHVSYARAREVALHTQCTGITVQVLHTETQSHMSNSSDDAFQVVIPSYAGLLQAQVQ